MTSFLLLLAIATFIGFISLGILSLYFIKYNSIFFFLSMIMLSLSSINFLIIYYSIYFIANKKATLKKPFLIFISSLIVCGIFSGLTFAKSLNFNYINHYDDFEMVSVFEQSYSVNDFEKVSIFLYENNIEYIIDDSLEDTFKIEIIQPKLFSYSVNQHYYEDESNQPIKELWIQSQSGNGLIIFKSVLNDFKKNTIREYDSYMATKIIVTISSDNFDLINLLNFWY